MSEKPGASANKRTEQDDSGERIIALTLVTQAAFAQLDLHQRSHTLLYIQAALQSLPADLKTPALLCRLQQLTAHPFY